MLSLRVASWVPCTEAEGPHRRAALWVAGCSIQCPGCCNPELFDPRAGELHTVGRLVSMAAEAQAQHGVEGISVLGGEPMDQAPALAQLLRGVQALGLGVIVYSGYALATLRARPDFEPVFSAVDTLVDGPFEAQRLESRATLRRRYLGSTNQSIVHRSARYADPALWRGNAGVEVQIGPGGEMSAHGEPALARRVLGLLERAR